MVLIGIKLPLLVIYFLTFFCSSDVNALTCKKCKGQAAADGNCESQVCEADQVCAKSTLKTVTVVGIDSAGTVSFGCIDLRKFPGLTAKVGTCGEDTTTVVGATGTIVREICLCDTDDCDPSGFPAVTQPDPAVLFKRDANADANSAKSFHNWTPISFIIWLGLFLIVGAFTGQQ